MLKDIELYSVVASNPSKVIKTNAFLDVVYPADIDPPGKREFTESCF